MPLTDSDRIARYAYRRWKRAGMTEWPRVREASKALRIPVREFEDLAAGSWDDSFQLTGYNYDLLVGDLWVEATTEDVERDWCEYWLPYSRGCYCGKHKHS